MLPTPACPDRLPDPGAAVDALLDTAAALERDGDRRAARAAYERALYASSAPEHAARASQILRWVARTHMTDGDAEAALDCLTAALATAEAWGDDAAAGHALNGCAIVQWRRGEMEDAERLYRQAGARGRACHDGRLVGLVEQNLGVLASVRGDYALARSHQEACLAQYRALGLASDVAGALTNLGVLHTCERRWAEAELALEEAVRVTAAAGNASVGALAAVSLAELWVARADLERAEATARHARALAESVGEARAAGQALKVLGVVALERGRGADADTLFDRAATLARTHTDLLLEAEVARERAELARRQGQNRELLQQLNRAHRLFTQLRARRELADIGRRMGQLEAEFVAVARRWGESIDAKDRYTQGHCQRVADLACRIAERAGAAEGFDAQAMFWFRIGALLHDVGKIDIPGEVLNKPGKLTDEEFALMRAHPEAGVAMLADVEFPWDVRPVVESHHERWDGRGYPHGLAGEQIPLTARILCVADVYDALTSVRSYKRAFAHDDALGIMRQDVGSMFDPRVFAWFEAVADEALAHRADEAGAAGARRVLTWAA